MSDLIPTEKDPVRNKAPHSNAQEYAKDEINLLDLALVIAKHKRMILLTAFIAAVLAAGASLMMPNIYRAEVLLSPVETGDSKSGLSSALGGLGGLASMAGVSLGGGGSTEENLAVLQSRDFLWAFVQEKKLMPILFEDEWDEEHKKWAEEDPKKQPGQMDVYRLFNQDGMLSVAKDKKTDLITVGVNMKDAAMAAEIANSLVEQANLYLAKESIARSERNLQYLNDELMRTQIEEMRKILFDLIANEQKKAMLANAQKEFAFKVLDPAVEPDKKIKPKRSLIVILAAFVAFFMAVIWASIREGIARSGQDPEQGQRMRELRQALRWKE